MTQQGDMTSEQPGTGQPGDLARLVAPAVAGQPDRQRAAQPADQPPAEEPAIYWPSPYLAEGQSVPEAYPAPARAGQPKYAEPSAQFQLGQQARYGRTGPGRARPPQRRLGQTGPGQGTQAVADQAAGQATATAADLVLASGWERMLAVTMDWMLILGVSFLLLHTQMIELWHRFQSMLVAAQTASPSAAQASLSSFEKSPATISAVVSYFLMVFLIALVYFWALQATSGATLGKRLLGLRVVLAADRSPAGIRATGIRTVLLLIGPAALTFAPNIGLLGDFVALIGAALWFTDSLSLVTDPQKRSLHDKVAGTLVVRKAPPKPPPSPW